MPRPKKTKPRDDAAAAAADQGGNDIVVRLAFQPPYDWPFVRDFLAARAMPGVEHVDGQSYARTVSCKGGHAFVNVCVLDGEDALELRVRGAPAGALHQLSSAARRCFDLASDPARIALAFQSDALLGPLVKRRPGARIPGAWDPFECAVRAVLGQQVSVAAGRTLAARLVARAGRAISSEADGLTHLFPGPQELGAADLEGLGLTGARIGALRALATSVTSGALDFDAPVEQVTAELVALPGLGEWTAQYVALRALGYADAFPAADLVLRRVASAGDVPLTMRALLARAEAWRPWRGYAVLHLWRAAAESAR